MTIFAEFGLDLVSSENSDLWYPQQAIALEEL